MANIDIEIGGRRYTVGCADGEEHQLRSVASMVDDRARDATHALGSLSDTMQLLYAALLLADDLREARARSGNGSDQEVRPETGNGQDSASPELAAALERIADRVERLAAGLNS